MTDTTDSPLSHALLEWSFVPPNALIGHFPAPCSGYALTFAEGTIQARVEADQWTKESGIQERIQVELECVLFALGMMRQTVISLAEPTLIEVRSDGRRIMYAEMHSTAIVSDHMAWRLVDANGNAVRDSLQEQRDRERALMEQVRLRAHDHVLHKMLRAYRVSQFEGANELIHLYEITETLATRFKGEHKARRILNVSDADWSGLGRVANNEPVREGRHRGKTIGELRSATSEELNNCRRVAQALIYAYLNYLGRAGADGSP